MLSRELLVPQLVDEVGPDAIRMYVEISGVVWFESSSEDGEVFEYVSEGRDEVEDGLFHRVVRLGHRGEEVVDRGPDEGNDEVHGVNPHGLWTGETEPGGRFHSDGCNGWLRHGVGRRGGGEREFRFINSLDVRGCETKRVRRDLASDIPRVGSLGWSLTRHQSTLVLPEPWRSSDREVGRRPGRVLEDERESVDG